MCRVHPEQMQMESSTGRIGTRNPNMQCLPHAVTLAAASSSMLALEGGEASGGGWGGEGGGVVGVGGCVVAREVSDVLCVFLCVCVCV